MVKIYYGIIIFCAVLGSFGQFALKKGSVDIELSQIVHNPNTLWLLSGLFLYGVAMVGYIFALNRGSLSLSVAYPLIATSYLFVLLISFWLLHEKVTAINIFGSILLLVSIWMMVR